LRPRSFIHILLSFRLYIIWLRQKIWVLFIVNWLLSVGDFFIGQSKASWINFGLAVFSLGDLASLFKVRSFPLFLKAKTIFNTTAKCIDHKWTIFFGIFILFLWKMQLCFSHRWIKKFFNILRNHTMSYRFSFILVWLSLRFLNFALIWILRINFVMIGLSDQSRLHLSTRVLLFFWLRLAIWQHKFPDNLLLAVFRNSQLITYLLIWPDILLQLFLNFFFMGMV
jgi:hypothetical protein